MADYTNKIKTTQEKICSFVALVFVVFVCFFCRSYMPVRCVLPHRALYVHIITTTIRKATNDSHRRVFTE